MFSLTSFRKNKFIKKVIDEDIHIVMCCWKRTQHLEYQVKMLNNQRLVSPHPSLSYETQRKYLISFT